MNLLLGRVRKDETPDEEKSSDILPCKKTYRLLSMIVSVIQSRLYIIVLFIFHILMPLVSYFQTLYNLYFGFVICTQFLSWCLIMR